MNSYIKHHVNSNSKMYTPKFPKKYGGEYPIIARSSWEIAFMQYLDINPNIVMWGSETTAIGYYDPIKKKNRRYYPDFLIKVRDKIGKEKIYMVEIKPWKEVQPPKVTKKKSEQSKIYESATYITNIAKWKAAEDYCKKHNMIFRILTERELFVEGRKK
jgi:hypothetical protein